MNRVKFLVDECLGVTLSSWLKKEGFDVVAIIEVMSGATDDEVLKKSFNENRVLLTSDKDFGEMVFKKNIPHSGIVLFRLQSNRSQDKIIILKNLINNYSDKLINSFIVASETGIKIIKVNFQ